MVGKRVYSHSALIYEPWGSLYGCSIRHIYPYLLGIQVFAVCAFLLCLAKSWMAIYCRSNDEENQRDPSYSSITPGYHIQEHVSAKKYVNVDKSQIAYTTRRLTLARWTSA